MGRLDVRIVEARNLPNTELVGSPDPYVIVTCENNTHKTSVASSTTNPKWDEVFKFVIADPDSSQLELKLWNKNMVSDDFMGQYKMSLAGLTKGVVKDVWVLLQQCKTNAEIHIRLMAHDFGAAPPAGAAVATAAPVVVQQQPVVVQQAQPVYQQPVVMQQPVYQQPVVMQQPVYQQPVVMQQPVFQQPVFQQPQFGQPQFGGAPHATFGDFQPVNLTGRVVRATYGTQFAPIDYTMQVQQMQQRGQNQVFGGIHTVIGDPAPGQPKVFSVWYG